MSKVPSQVFLWTIPRGGSTVFYKSMTANGDIKGFFEPFATANRCGPDSSLTSSCREKGLSLEPEYTFDAVRGWLEAEQISGIILVETRMRDILRKIMHPDPSRSILLDPTKHLVDSMNTNNVSRIKSAIILPCVDLHIRIQKHQQMTILMRLCYLDISSKSRKDLVNLVLENVSCFGDLLDAQDLTGKTVLAHACIQEDEEMIKLLAKDGMVDPEIGDDEGNSPLMHAVMTENAGVVKTLIQYFKKYGLDVNSVNKEGISPLVEAARLGNIDVIRALVIDGEADVNQRDRNRNCAQDYLVVNGNGSVSDLLLLCPAAQRKRQARERRLVEGRKSMMNLVNEASVPKRASVSEDGGRKKSKSQMTKSMTSMAGLPSYVKLPLTQEYTGQLNSVVFQLASCIPMLEEKPLEEDRENFENAKSSRITQRRRSSSLSDLEELHQKSFFDNYMVNYFSNDSVSVSELSLRKCLDNHNNSLSSSMENLDGRLRLQPISDGGSRNKSPRDIASSPKKSRNHLQRRSSMPVDLHKFTGNQEEKPPARRSQSFSRDLPKPVRDEGKSTVNKNGRRGSFPSLDDSTRLRSSSQSSLPTSPRPNGVSKNSDPPSPTSKTAARPIRRLSDPLDETSEANRQKNYSTTRRSSLPQIDTSSNQSQSITSARNTKPRRSINVTKNKKTESISIVHRPRAVESRVKTSWEGKSSKSVPSYLFR